MNPDIRHNTPLTKKEFWDKYWFSPLQMVTLVNPKTEAYNFMVEMRHFVIKPGATEQMPGTVANVYLSQMTRIMAQDDDRMEFLSDFNLMKLYYDKLIMDVKDMMQTANNVPAYLSKMPESMKGDAPETPPWQAPVESTIPETNSQMKNTWEAPKTPVTQANSDNAPAPKETTKEFEYEGAKYKMTVDRNDKEMFFKNGTRINAADYAKAASML